MVGHSLSSRQLDGGSPTKAAFIGSSPIGSTKLTIKEEFKTKVDELLRRIQGRIKAFNLPLKIRVDRTDVRVIVTLIPNHPLGEVNSLSYCVWIFQEEIRWSVLKG